MRRTSLACTVAFFAFLFLVASAHAQYRASLQGTVTDPQGAVIADAGVTLTNIETGRTEQAKTNAGGVYNFNGLAPSTYSIKVEKAGFKLQVLDNIQVIAEQANAIDVVLQLGQTTETVTVTDATPANTTFVNGSLKVTPIALDDNYTAIGNTKLFIG